MSVFLPLETDRNLLLLDVIRISSVSNSNKQYNSFLKRVVKSLNIFPDVSLSNVPLQSFCHFSISTLNEVDNLTTYKPYSPMIFLYKQFARIASFSNREAINYCKLICIKLFLNLLWSVRNTGEKYFRLHIL